MLLNTYDRAGGAARVAFDLFRTYQSLGHDVRMLVRHKRTSDDDVIEIDPYAYTTTWAPLCAMLEKQIMQLPRFRGRYRLADWLRRCAMPQRWFDHMRGIEDFNYPYSYHILQNPEWTPDVIHVHNMHGDFFDVRALAPLSQRIPVVWTLHDAWALTGHCAHPINCERWRIGCGKCPDLHRPPSIQRDGTAQNWKRKQKVYASSRLAIATPSQWLMKYVHQSILRAQHMRVIPLGVDQTVYKPGDRMHARTLLGLPYNAFICVFVAYSAKTTNPYKDITTINRAVQQVITQLDSRNMLFLCVGQSKHQNTHQHFAFTGYVADPKRVALYYQAADVMIHAANVDNFPCVILEALACGTPVIATAVGGIPEQIDDGVNGYLVPRSDAEAMADHILDLARHPARARQMGQLAAESAKKSFGLNRQAALYIEWFQELREMYQLGDLCDQRS
ncbi:MAG: glycosyltransferase [Chloroflexales bacterium]|nr:glycosyltransferase [Chloroflexales bacterium]